ncbi:MAG: CBS domain-containing protein, partial [Nitrospirae bacterium]
GGTFGAIVHNLFPALTASAGAYATVGVGAFLAAVTHAPLTGMFLLFEMTGNYQIIIPIMISATLGTFVSHRLFRDSIDTYELALRGINLHAGREVMILQTIPVKDVMRRDFLTVRDRVNLKEFLELVIEGPGGFYYPVVNGNGEMVGIISLQDVRKVLFEDYIKEVVTVGALCTEDVKVLYPDDTLAKAMNHFAEMDIDEIPVVDPKNPKKVIGMLRRGDVVSIYNREVLRRQAE